MGYPILSCDKLVVIGKESPHLDFILKKSLAIESYGIAHLPYKYYYKFRDGTFLQIGERKSGQSAIVRYEFNPNKPSLLDENGHDIVTNILGGIYFERFSRIDVALDYLDYDLGEVNWLQVNGKGKKTVSYRDGAGRLETLYIGSPESNLMHRIYNKAKERNDKGERYEGLWWRIEAVVKFDKEQMLHPFMNPFDCIMGVLENDFSKLSWEDIACCDFLTKHPETLARLDSRKKRKYKDMIVSNSRFLSPSPKDVYEKENDKLFGQLAEFKSKCLKSPLVIQL